MAVPKRKVSKQRSNTRYATWKVAAPDLMECPTCHELKQSHRVCRACGSYDGEKKLEIKKEKAKE